MSNPQQPIEFIPFKAPYGYYENPQSVELRMAFVNKVNNTYKEMFTPVMCRDYFSDILHAEHFKIKSDRIYGFSYDARKLHIDRDKTRLSLWCASNTGFNNIETNALQILHPIEKQNNFIPSVLLKPTEKTLIIEGDSTWLKSSFLLASYTLILRLSGLPLITPDKWQEEIISRDKDSQADTKKFSTDSIFHADVSFLCHNNKIWLRLLPKLAQFASLHESLGIPPTGWPLETNISVIHNKSGVASCSIPGINLGLDKIRNQIIN